MRPFVRSLALSWVAVAVAVGGARISVAVEDAPSGKTGDSGYRVTVDLDEAIRSLGTDDLFEREPAETLLGALDEKALPALATALEREDEDVRVGVVEVLGSLEAEGATELLLQRAEGDPSIRVRAAAVSALVSRGTPEAATVVTRALHSEDPRLYRAAVEGCGRHCTSPADLDRVVQLALDEPFVLMRVPRTALLRAGSASDGRAAVASAVERVAVPRLDDTEPATRVRAALLLADLGDGRARSPLALALDHEMAPLLRAEAILALGRLGDDETVAVLVRARESLPGGLASAACKALAILAERGVAGARAADPSCDAPTAGRKRARAPGMTRAPSSMSMRAP